MIIRQTHNSTLTTVRSQQYAHSLYFNNNINAFLIKIKRLMQSDWPSCDCKSLFETNFTTKLAKILLFQAV